MCPQYPFGLFWHLGSRWEVVEVAKSNLSGDLNEQRLDNSDCERETLTACI